MATVPVRNLGRTHFGWMAQLVKTHELFVPTNVALFCGIRITSSAQLVAELVTEFFGFGNFV
jgi:hypothetical protein